MSKKYTTNFLEDTNGSTGSANQVLISTPSGIDWVDGSGSSIIGGPYLPLAGGTMTGQLTFPCGFLGDYIYHTGDSNTYFGFSSSDTFSLFTGGSNRLHVNSAGNVGIGTTSPSAKLHLEGDAIIEGVLRADNFNLGLGGAIKLKASNSLTDQYVAFGTTPSGSNGNATFTEKMRINSDGNVGIGTTSPDFKLDVAGDMGIDGYIYHNGDDSRIGFEGNDAIRMYTANSVRLQINSNGNVGIGTTSPQSKLHIETGSGGTYNPNTNHDDVTIEGSGNIGLQLFSPNSSYQYIAFGDPDSANAGYLRYYHGANEMVFRTSNSDKMVITSSGNVGIGTTSPQYKLDVNGNIVIRGSSFPQLLFIETGSTYTDGMRLLRNQDKLSLTYGWNANEEALTVVGGTGSDVGNVGIGTTSPDAKLHVNGNIRIPNAGKIVFGTAGSPNDYLELNDITSSGKLLKLVQDGATRFDINGVNGNVYMQGNVGIGTTSPDTKLSINDVLGISGTGNNTYGQVDLVNTQTGASGDEIGPFITFRGKRGAVDTTIAAYGAIGAVNTGVTGNSTGALTFLVKNAIGAAQDLVEQMRISTGGNVGIGTTSPGEKLEVAGKGLFTGTEVKVQNASDPSIQVSDTDANYKGAMRWLSSDNVLEFYTRYAGTYYTSNLVLDRGNVGIGTTSPDVQLELGNNTADEKLRLTGAASGKPLMTFYNTTTKIGQISSSSVGVTVTSLGSGNMTFENGGGARLVIDNSGNVGIADTSPSYKLDVDGTIRATGDVIAYSDIRIKENIKTIDNALEKVNKLRGVEFNKIGSEEKSIGVVAQEIEKVLPEVVKEDDKGMKSVAYGNIVGVLIEAIKDQQKQIDELKSIINGGTK